MDYLPTLGEKWPHSRGNVGKYSLHGSYGNQPFTKRELSFRSVFWTTLSSCWAPAFGPSNGRSNGRYVGSDCLDSLVWRIRCPVKADMKKRTSG